MWVSAYWTGSLHIWSSSASSAFRPLFQGSFAHFRNTILSAAIKTEYLYSLRVEHWIGLLAFQFRTNRKYSKDNPRTVEQILFFQTRIGQHSSPKGQASSFPRHIQIVKRSWDATQCEPVPTFKLCCCHQIQNDCWMFSIRCRCIELWSVEAVISAACQLIITF